MTRIYVACLASYNSGILHGAWIDCAGKDAEDIMAEVSDMLRKSPEHGAEEWAIHDHEGFYGLIGEHTSLDDVAALAEVLTDEGYMGAIALEWLVKDCGYSLADAIDKQSDVCLFEGSVVEYAQELVNDLYGHDLDKMGHLANYIDYDAFARDLEISGDVAVIHEGASRYVITNASEF